MKKNEAYKKASESSEKYQKIIAVVHSETFGWGTAVVTKDNHPNLIHRRYTFTNRGDDNLIVCYQYGSPLVASNVANTVIFVDKPVTA